MPPWPGVTRETPLRHVAYTREYLGLGVFALLAR